MASRTRAANRPGGYPARPKVRTPRSHGGAARTAADTEAAKRVLLHVMSYLELLAADVADLMAALDQAKLAPWPPSCSMIQMIYGGTTRARRRVRRAIRIRRALIAS